MSNRRYLALALPRWAAALIDAIALALLVACGGGGAGGDSGGSGSGQGNDPVAPLEVIAKIEANTASPITGQEVRLSPDVSFKGTIPAGTTLTEVRWDFGDGSAPVSITDTASFSAAQYKSYAQTGTFTVTLSATASTGESGSITRSISVQSYATTGVLANSGLNNGPPFNIGDYTRLGADGQPLAIQTATWADTGNNADGTRWECIQDKQSGLIWEVKTKHDFSDLRYYGSRYTWYDSNPATNRGYAGEEFYNNCLGLGVKCNTQAYTTAVNALPTGQALCGFRDWRMPRREELRSIQWIQGSSPQIRAEHFPDVWGSPTWSSTSFLGVNTTAWFIDFNTGTSSNASKSNAYSVRLVRSGR